MKPLHNRCEYDVPKAEPSRLLGSNTDVMHDSALGINQEPPVEMLLDQLAAIIVEVFFYEQNNK